MKSGDLSFCSSSAGSEDLALQGWLGSLLGQFSSPAASFLPYTAELGPRPREQGLTPKNSESRGRGATLEEQPPGAVTEGHWEGPFKKGFESYGW